MTKLFGTRLTALLTVGVLLTSCAFAFPYKRFALQGDGRLLAAKAEDDRSIRDCVTPQGGSRCFVFFSDEYERMRKDYAEAQRKLKRCGKACK